MGQPNGYYILHNETSEEFQITNCTDNADTEGVFKLNNFDDTIVNFQAVKTTQCWKGNGYIDKYNKFEVDGKKISTNSTISPFEKAELRGG